MFENVYFVILVCRLVNSQKIVAYLDFSYIQFSGKLLFRSYLHEVILIIVLINAGLASHRISLSFNRNLISSPVHNVLVLELSPHRYVCYLEVSSFCHGFAKTFSVDFPVLITLFPVHC